MGRQLLFLFGLLAGCGGFTACTQQGPPPPQLQLEIFSHDALRHDLPLPGRHQRIHVRSSIDGSLQPSELLLPQALLNAGAKRVPRPLLVSLHTWSVGSSCRHHALEHLALAQGWIYLFPHFRGANDEPAACGSTLAQQDILDAVAHVRRQYPVDRQRIYLVGVGGGGHMALLMASCHTKLWAGASVWAAITDLAAYYDHHAHDAYGASLRRSLGGPPAMSRSIDEQYRRRSPISHLDRALDLPLDIYAGIRDGHLGPVPISHSLRAYNALAAAQGATTISPSDMQEFCRGGLSRLQPKDPGVDPVLGRRIWLRRQAGKARLTIFDGGHEMLAHAVILWLRAQAREQEPAPPELRR